MLPGRVPPAAPPEPTPPATENSESHAMRITTWNVNSVRLRLGLVERVIAETGCDVLCLQETKAGDDVFPADAIAAMGMDHQLIRGMKNYNGVAILSRLPLKEGPTRDWCGKQDCRHVSAVLPGNIELHNFYVPAGGDEPDPKTNDKFAHKLAFVDEMASWFADMKQAKRVLVGDLNIAPLETDVWSHKQLLKVVSHTPVEVEGLGKAMAAHGWQDAVRQIIPESETIYSWWSYRNRSWPGSDRGRRLDHVWVTPKLVKAVKDAAILRDARGWTKPSDHVPVTVELAD